MKFLGKLVTDTGETPERAITNPHLVAQFWKSLNDHSEQDLISMKKRVLDAQNGFLKKETLSASVCSEKNGIDDAKMACFENFQFSNLDF